MKTGIMVKLGHLKEPVVDPKDTQVFPGDGVLGEYNEIVIGERFEVARGANYINTSAVKSIYVHGSESFDKLMLPAGFPEPEFLDFPELKDGDTLIATMNSVYLLRQINGKQETAKEESKEGT